MTSPARDCERRQHKPAATAQTLRHADDADHPAVGCGGSATRPTVESVSEQLNVSETTVKTHDSALLRRLGLRDRVQAVVFAYQMGVVNPRR